MNVKDINFLMEDGRTVKHLNKGGTEIRTKYKTEKKRKCFYVLLTVHLSITLVNDQLDAQLFYFIMRLLQSSTCFEQRRVHHQEVKLY